MDRNSEHRENSSYKRIKSFISSTVKEGVRALPEVAKTALLFALPTAAGSQAYNRYKCFSLMRKNPNKPPFQYCLTATYGDDNGDQRAHVIPLLKADCGANFNVRVPKSDLTGHKDYGISNQGIPAISLYYAGEGAERHDSCINTTLSENVKPYSKSSWGPGHNSESDNSNFARIILMIGLGLLLLIAVLTIKCVLAPRRRNRAMINVRNQSPTLVNVDDPNTNESKFQNLKERLENVAEIINEQHINSVKMLKNDLDDFEKTYTCPIGSTIMEEPTGLQCSNDPENPQVLHFFELMNIMQVDKCPLDYKPFNAENLTVNQDKKDEILQALNQLTKRIEDLEQLATPLYQQGFYSQLTDNDIEIENLTGLKKAF